MSGSRLTKSVGAFLLGLSLSGCHSDHRKNCEDLCEALVECRPDRACEYVGDDDVKACRKGCNDTDGTFDKECVACLASDFSCDVGVSEECSESCYSADFSDYPSYEWFCDGEPLVQR